MARLLLLGESAASARYLTGTIAEGGHDLTHIEGRETLTAPPAPFDVVIISDYAASRLGEAAASAIVAAVEAGAGLIMLGGWGSFTGLNGQWGSTPVGRLLPVVCAEVDDRRNVASGVWLEPVVADHPVLAGLDFAQPPVVCGYNEVTPASEASVLLHGRQVRFEAPRDGMLSPAAGASVPLLVVGAAGRGRAVTYMSDLVPHWCGGIVDWGQRRLRLSSGAEVGDQYVAFLLNLVAWAADA
jgi:uncharacterized membrane protein